MLLSGRSEGLPVAGFESLSSQGKGPVEAHHVVRLADPEGR